MIVNYHTHTPRCHHATGTEEEYVQCALQAGVQTLGFSDHTAYPFPKGFVSGFRMGVEEFPGYADAVRAVKKQFANQIDIRLGVEAEFYPTYFSDMLSLLRDNGVEYMILGQHMLGDEIGESYLGVPSGADDLERYCNQCMDAIYTGLFTYFAHPDLLHYVGSPEIYRTKMRRLCRAAKSCGIPLEINLLGLRGGRHYPNTLFWDIAAEEGCDVLLGRDAHDPQHLLDTATEKAARDMAARLGITLLETVELKKL